MTEVAEGFRKNNPNLDYPKPKMNQGGDKFPKDLWIGWPRWNKLVNKLVNKLENKLENK